MGEADERTGTLRIQGRMELDGPELRSLSAFYARRFPRRGDRLRAAQAVGLTDEWVDFPDPEAAWESLIGRAQVVGKLHALAEWAATERPKDENLAEMMRTLRGASRSPLGPVRGLGFGLLVGIVVGRATAPVPDAPTPVVVSVPTEAPPPEAAPSAPTRETPAEPDVGLAFPADRRPPPIVAEVSSALPEGCRGPAGEVVGYWYAGETAPGSAGSTITMDRALRVRADYPREDNGWNKAAPERCVLRPGLALSISQAPLSVKGGGWWVPLVPEDVR